MTNNMQKTTTLLFLVAVTLVSAPVFGPSHSVGQIDPCYATSAQLLRADAGRLYLWVDAPFVITPDFRIGVSIDGQVTVDCAVATVADRVVVSESLAVTLLGDLKSATRLVFSIYLDTSRIAADTLRVGVPAIFKGEYSFVSPTDSASHLPTVIDWRYYQKLTEAEIDLAIGRIDLLIVPETEVPEDASCKYRIEPTGNYVEWFFFSDLPDNDLYTCALNYCLKSQFVDSGEVATLLIDTALINRGFPRHKEKARALFEQVRASLSSRRCSFEPAMLPGLVSKLERELLNCGGRLSFDARADDTRIWLLHSAQPDRASAEETQQDVRGVFFKSCVSGGWLPQADLPDACRGGDSLAAICQQELQTWLSRECRFIPLGRMDLTALVRNDIHNVPDRAGRFALRDFYRVK